MPQLEEDEWPEPGQPTTTETERLKDSEKDPTRAGTWSEYPPELPPDALPTKD